MAITIKMRDEKWFLEITGEEWKIEKREKLDEVLKHLLNMKGEHGKIK